MSELKAHIAKLQDELDRPIENSAVSNSVVSIKEWEEFELLDCPANAIAPTEEMEPAVRLINRGGRQEKSFVFRKLHSPLGKVLAENVEFRDAVGLTVRFWNSGGTLTFGADQVHPVVLTSVGLRADLGLRAEAARLNADTSNYRSLGEIKSLNSPESDYERRLEQKIRQQQLEIQNLEAARRLEFLKTNRSGSEFYIPPL